MGSLRNKNKRITKKESWLGMIKKLIINIFTNKNKVELILIDFIKFYSNIKNTPAYDVDIEIVRCVIKDNNVNIKNINNYLLLEKCCIEYVDLYCASIRFDIIYGPVHDTEYFVNKL